jgi:AcrR family transcriptional regulator
MTKNSDTGPVPTRERILQAAIELVAEVGADRLRTRAVAERAEVNPALVHYHFGSMAALVRAAEEKVVAEEAEPIVEALWREAGIQTAVQGVFDAIQQLGEPTPSIMVMNDIMARATRDPSARARARDMLAGFRVLIRDRLAEAQRRREIGPHVDIDAAAVMLAALLDGLGMHRLIDQSLDVRAVAGLLLTALTDPAPNNAPGAAGAPGTAPTPAAAADDTPGGTDEPTS